ncbi:MAG: hypothetical protein HY924_03425 [Elusimicrobia bacterium]|nr:hypothetical protein [Elusimicrobiota bacterium]
MTKVLRSFLAAALLALLCGGASAADKAKVPAKGGPGQALSRAGVVPPKGWEKEEVFTRADPYVSFTLGEDIIKVRLLGGPGSRYAKPEDFLKGFEAATMGRPPERVREVKVAGEKAWLHRHGYPIMLGDPHLFDPKPPRLAMEEFVVLPRGRRFFVLSWAHESPIPDPDAVGEKAWEGFLASFTPEPAKASKPRR